MPTLELTLKRLCPTCGAIKDEPCVDRRDRITTTHASRIRD